MNLSKPLLERGSHETVISPQVAVTDAGNREKASAGELKHRFFIFFTGSIYSYGPLMVYPLYKELVRARGEVEAPAAVITLCLTVSKLLAALVHSGGVQLVGHNLGQLKVFVVVMFLACAFGLIGASAPTTSSFWVVMGICTMNFTSSRIIGGTLLTVPDESSIKLRTFIYDLAAQPGCLWVSLVVFLLESNLAKDSGVFRFCALALPLGFALVSWLSVSSREFFNAAKLADFQKQQYQQQLTDDDEKVVFAPALDAEHVWNLKDGNESETTASDIEAAITDAEVIVSDSESTQSEITALGGAALVSSDASGKQSPWANAEFRVIAATFFLNFWSYNFYAYTAFPIIITESGGPSLATVSMLYTVEGLVYSLIMVIAMPFLRSRVFQLYFGSAWLITLLPPLAICIVPYLHWSCYLVVLTMMDILSAIINTTLGVVLLRCLSWDVLPTFYSQTSAVGVTLLALSTLQLGMHESLGWAATAIIGHGVPLFCVGVVYMLHPRALQLIFARCNVEAAP